ncbi:Sfum_1244 family protein [Dissulfurispira sp.]|uniref:Sfum_1244 family protein n=1 Tax=Dissulfurispira sp. TaxID=2817609 RepID=UPI002FD99855
MAHVLNKPIPINTLIDDIKFNCEVSDAKYWGHFSICGLLMRLRDLYRSEHNLKPWGHINRQAISEWISQKENLWKDLEDKDFRDLIINGQRYHPFEVFDINQILKDYGLVYGAGYGLYMKPTFFLAELLSKKEMYDYTIYTTKQEYVRDIFSSAAMLQGRCIFLRLEPLKTLLWEKFLDFRAKGDTARGYAFPMSGFKPDEDMDENFEKRLDELADRYSSVLLYHELGEAIEDIPDWHDILIKTEDRNIEYFLRALKDLISDTSDYGPLKRIVDTKDNVSLVLFVAFLEGYRKTMYPEIKEVFTKFIGKEDWNLIDDIRISGHTRFVLLRKKAVEAYKTCGSKEDIAKRIKELIEADTGMSHRR